MPNQTGANRSGRGRSVLVARRMGIYQTLKLMRNLTRPHPPKAFSSIWRRRSSDEGPAARLRSDWANIRNELLTAQEHLHMPVHVGGEPLFRIGVSLAWRGLRKPLYERPEGTCFFNSISLDRVSCTLRLQESSSGVRAQLARHSKANGEQCPGARGCESKLWTCRFYDVLCNETKAPCALFSGISTRCLPRLTANWFDGGRTRGK
jgi:hypothetical protein